jgi:hypothetical protein
MTAEGFQKINHLIELEANSQGRVEHVKTMLQRRLSYHVGTVPKVV